MPLSDNISFDENGIYIPQTWLDGTGEGNYTPITADRMNHIEQGIVGLSEAWDSQSQILSDGSILINHGGGLVTLKGKHSDPAAAESNHRIYFSLPLKFREVKHSLVAAKHEGDIACTMHFWQVLTNAIELYISCSFASYNVVTYYEVTGYLE